jgi:hypothetical protein
MDEKKLYKDAIVNGGTQLQFHMAMEEALELALTILRLYRKRATLRDVASEVADVEILCGQLRLMLGDDVVDRIKQSKLERLRIRINENQLVNYRSGDEASWPLFDELFGNTKGSVEVS